MTITEKVQAYLREADLLTVLESECSMAICRASETTLRRRLLEEGSSYGALLWDERRRRAEELMRRNRHADQWTLAKVMGYRQRNSAGRAFQKLFGINHREFRRASA